MKKYKIIYADPPWQYKDKSSAGKRGVHYKYPLMDIEDIKNLPIKNIIDNDCILFLWVTFPLLQEGLDVISAWGFSYKTCGFTWIKSNKREGSNQPKLFDTGLDDFIGMGNWTRSNAELCLIGVKGKLKRINTNIRQILYHPIMKHSKKPPIVRDKIVKLCGDLPRCELFARQKTEDWDIWGNEIENDIEIKNSSD